MAADETPTGSLGLQTVKLKLKLLGCQRSLRPLLQLPLHFHCLFLLTVLRACLLGGRNSRPSFEGGR